MSSSIRPTSPLIRKRGRSPRSGCAPFTTRKSRRRAIICRPHCRIPICIPTRRSEARLSAAPAWAVLTHGFDVCAAKFGELKKRRTVSVIYSVRGISKRFGAVPALQGVDFDVVEGKVNGLVGANGAGKSTLLKIIAGALPPDAGEIKLDGRPLAIQSITDAARAGIAIVSQELSLFPALSVEENLLLAPGAGAWQARRAFGRRARAILERLGVDVALHTPLYRLSLADRQLVEIARAMLQNPRVLILDEPTLSLHVAEVERLHDIIRSLRD